MNNKRVYILKEYIIKEIKSLIKEENVLIPRRSPEERRKNYIISIQKKIQQYIKDGSKGNLVLTGTPITSLPDNLTVNWYLYLDNTPISKKYTKEQLKQMLPGVKNVTL
jgi:hypothetical protein